MKLIIGLGNPGNQYINTRHNLGFMALDYFQKSIGVFSPWQPNDKFKAEISEGQINDQKIILAKPETFMNLSGQAVRAIVDFYKIPATDIFVLHDDLDLLLGQLRISQNSSAGGHKGVDSLIKTLGSKDFIRIRLGIKPEKLSLLNKIFKTPVEKFVLQKFTAGEKDAVSQAIKKASEALLLAINYGLSQAQTKFN